MPTFPPIATDSQSAIAAPSEVSRVCHVDTLVDRCLGDTALAARLWKRFEERLPRAIGEIERSLAEGNRSDARKRAHSLKGEAASLAAHRLQHAATELENTLRCDPDAADHDLARMSLALQTAADQCRECMPLIFEALATLNADAT